MYKSDESSLRKRGKFNSEDYLRFKDESYCTLVKMVNDLDAVKRSVAINILQGEIIKSEDLTRMVLNRLMIEKALYVRLEICSALEKGGANVAKIMINYLSKIGNNQYKKVPDKVSKKVSFPLPRDLIARTLGNMNKENFSILINAIYKVNREELSELIDAIGMMVYKNKELATDENLQYIVDIMEKYKGDELIVWKCVVTLMSFPLKRSVLILNQIKNIYNNLKDEANRSLSLIENKIK